MKSPNKFWRYSSAKSFYPDAIDYVDKHIAKIESEYEDDRALSDNAKHKLKDMIRDYKDAKFLKLPPEIILARGCEVVKLDVSDWANFSSAVDSSLKDIAIRAVLGELYKFNYVCLLLLSHNQNITEDFIEDLMYITSGYFKFSEWDNTHVNAICNCVLEGNNANVNEDMINAYKYSRLKSSPVKMKFDIDNFVGRPLSKAFVNKYIQFIKFPEAEITAD